MTIAYWCVLVVVLIPTSCQLLRARRSHVTSTFAIQEVTASRSRDGDGAPTWLVCLRLAHAALYIADRPQLRSHAWRLGIICIIAMFIDAAVWGQR
jgi:uncharacterized MAPEG superfamily protein